MSKPVTLDLATHELVLLPSLFDRRSMSIPIEGKRDTATVGKIRGEVEQIARDEKLDAEKVWERLAGRNYIRVWLQRGCFTEADLDKWWKAKFLQFNSIDVIFTSYKNKDGPGVGLRMTATGDLV